MKVIKFGGSSLADDIQFRKVGKIITSDPARRVVVVSAPGKGINDPIKVTDMLMQKNFQKQSKNYCNRKSVVVYYGSCLFRDEAVSCRHGHGG